MADEFKIHQNKKPDRTYISRGIETKDLITEDVRKIRIVSKVVDSPEAHAFATMKKELIIRVTEKERQELVAKFYEDSRGVYVLTFQKFTKQTGIPHSVSFSFVGDEIKKIL